MSSVGGWVSGNRYAPLRPDFESELLFFMGLEIERPLTRAMRRGRILPASFHQEPPRPRRRPERFDATMQLVEVVEDPMESHQGRLHYEMVTHDPRVINYVIDRFQPHGTRVRMFHHIASVQCQEGQMDDGRVCYAYQIAIHGEDPDLVRLVNCKLPRITHLDPKQ